MNRSDDVDWGVDEEDFLLAAAMNDDDDTSTVATADSQASSTTSQFCECPDPVADPKKTLVDSHKRYIITKFLYNRQEPGIKTMATAYSIKNERSLKSTKLILRDAW